MSITPEQIVVLEAAAALLRSQSRSLSEKLYTVAAELHQEMKNQFATEADLVLTRNALENAQAALIQKRRA